MLRAARTRPIRIGLVRSVNNNFLKKKKIDRDRERSGWSQMRMQLGRREHTGDKRAVFSRALGFVVFAALVPACFCLDLVLLLSIAASFWPISGRRRPVARATLQLGGHSQAFLGIPTRGQLTALTEGTHSNGRSLSYRGGWSLPHQPAPQSTLSGPLDE